MKLDDGTILTDGNSKIRELNNYLNWEIPEYNSKTINGLITEQLDQIPQTSLCLQIEEYRFEILEIVRLLGIEELFNEIYGSPLEKSLVIRNELKDKKDYYKCIMIGDSHNDLFAAKENNIDFLLRKTPYNISLQNQSHIVSIKDFVDFK